MIKLINETPWKGRQAEIRGKTDELFGENSSDITLMRNVLYINPLDLKEGLKKYVESLKLIV